jgi:membrane protease subunit (stomatin/prohibitin family)
VFRDNDYFQGKSPIDVDIIFMSKKAKIQIAWGSPTGFDFKDPVYDVDVHVGASGVLEVQVGNPRKFFSEVVGRDSVYNKEKLKEKIKTRLISRIQPAIAEFMKENKLSYIDFTQNTLKIADGIQPVIRADLADQYGVNMFDFIIEAIVISDTDKAAIKAKRERLEQKPEQDQEKALDRADFVSERDFQHAVEMRKLDIEERKAAAPVYHNSAPSKTVCPHCNTELPAGAKFCFSCGRSPKNVCPDCKIENPPQAKFCLSCGKKLH